MSVCFQDLRLRIYLEPSYHRGFRFPLYVTMGVPHNSEPKNTIIFEPNDNARRDRRSLTARLYLTDVARYCPNGVGEAVVKRIEYRKSSEAPNHEFLLCYVEDCNLSTRQAVIRIERCKSDQASPASPPLLPTTHISHDALHSSSPSSFGSAADSFTITCDINAKRSDAMLSTLIFDDNSAFTADETAMICQIVSECDDEYSALGHQCFWYADTIYKIIRKIHSTHIMETLAEGHKRKGMGRGVKIKTNAFIPSTHFPEKLAQIHLERWPKWQAGIEVAKEVRFSFIARDGTTADGVILEEEK